MQMQEKRKIMCAILFISGFIIGWAYTFWLPEVIMRNAGTPVFGVTAYLYKGFFMSIPMIIGGVIIGVVDILFTDSFSTKLLYAAWFGAWPTVYPLFGNYIIHPIPGTWIYAFAGVGVSVITTSIVHILKTKLLSSIIRPM